MRNENRSSCTPGGQTPPDVRRRWIVWQRVQPPGGTWDATGARTYEAFAKKGIRIVIVWRRSLCGLGANDSGR
jgi:hypothetical protein